MELRQRLAKSIVLGLAVTAAGRVEAGVVTYTDIDAFLAAADDAREIDFETLPDGSPSVSGTEITPEFNYTGQGVTFSSAAPPLRILLTGELFYLTAGIASEPRNWIIADLVTPAWAVGVAFPGSTTLSVFDTKEHLLGSIDHGGSGVGFFAGIVSDEPIAFATADSGTSGEVIGSFLFTPVPEPTTLVMVGVCTVILFLRRRP